MHRNIFGDGEDKNGEKTNKIFYQLCQIRGNGSPCSLKWQGTPCLVCYYLLTSQWPGLESFSALMGRTVLLWLIFIFTRFYSVEGVLLRLPLGFSFLTILAVDLLGIFSMPMYITRYMVVALMTHWPNAARKRLAIFSGDHWHSCSLCPHVLRCCKCLAI